MGRQNRSVAGCTRLALSLVPCQLFHLDSQETPLVAREMTIERLLHTTNPSGPKMKFRLSPNQSRASLGAHVGRLWWTESSPTRRDGASCCRHCR